MKISSRNTLILLCLAILFLAPGLAAVYFYKHPDGLEGVGTNQGDFVSPPKLIASLRQPGATDKAFNSAPKWHLVLWTPGECAEACMTTLEQLARIRLALGRYYYQVDEALLLESSHRSIPQSLTGPLRDQTIQRVHLSSDEVEALTQYAKEPKIFIADPDGFLILSYDVTAKSEAIYHDMKHLLTTTQTKGN